MTGHLHHWRDTLQDLGVMGLIPPPYQPEVIPETLPAPEKSLPIKQVKLEKTSNAPVPVAAGPIALPPPEAVAGAANLEALEACIRGCLACPLGAHRVKFVFGEGDPAARILFVGEGPGRDEDLQGRPFVGKAGELLDKMLNAIGLERSAVYICNVVKCRPPDNRTPTPEEARTCLSYLRRQIELIRPSVIVTLGATPLRELLGISTGITRIRGQWQSLDMLGGIPVMPTFHPAYVLRQYTQDVRRAVWSDLQAARNWLTEPRTGK
jgi:uracil-DNA glycosylase